MLPRLTLSNAIAALTFLMFAALPLYAEWQDDPFLISMFTRIVILAIAAVSLNIILGFGGMVSFGHAAYLGIGGYTIAIMAKHGMTSGFAQWPLAIGISAVFALCIGALSLRTKGVYFIMITLAFAQMVYFMGAGAYAYGGDDGLNIYTRSQFAGLFSIDTKVNLYYFSLAMLLLAVWFCHRLVNSRFGMVIRGAKSNERRMLAIGFPTYRYRLTAFTLAGALCGFAGALLANHTDFVSPAVMHWTKSGDLIVMVVLGGMGTLMGPVYGTLAFLFLEETLSGFTEYWKIIFGPLLICVVLFGRGGLQGFIDAFLVPRLARLKR